MSRNYYPSSWIYNNIVYSKMEEMAYMFNNAITANSRVKLNGDDNAKPVYLFQKKYDVIDIKQQELFLHHFMSILWFTYRKDFIPLRPPSSYTSDTGWGCMLRVSQMILGQVLIRHLLPNDLVSNYSEIISSLEYINIIKWFIDAPILSSLYSIHRITQCGETYGKQPGEWYGPSTASYVLRDLVMAHNERASLQANDKDSLNNKNNQSLIMIVADNATICHDEILSQCQTLYTAPSETSDFDPFLNPKPAPLWKSALFLLVPIRLGLDELNPAYIKPLLACLKFPQCVGFMGGRPSHALYFVGSQGDNLVYLDPHTVHASATSTNDDNIESNDVITDEDLATYSCKIPKVISAASIDPTLALGFYCFDYNDYVDLCARIGQLKAIGPIMISIMQSRPVYNDDEVDLSDDDVSHVKSDETASNKGGSKSDNLKAPDADDDEFVFL